MLQIFKPFSSPSRLFGQWGENGFSVVFLFLMVMDF